MTLLSLLYSSRKTPVEYLTVLKHFRCAHCRTGAPVIGFTGWEGKPITPACRECMMTWAPAPALREN